MLVYINHISCYSNSVMIVLYQPWKPCPCGKYPIYRCFSLTKPSFSWDFPLPPLMAGGSELRVSRF